MCLGLFYKKDYVRHLLHEHDLDLLLLQETEINTNTLTINLQIGGYNLELETNDMKKRVGIYIKKSINYTRRHDKEKKNYHIIILDVGGNKITRIINIYRTFSPQELITPKEKFSIQLRTINAAINDATVVAGDMNLDEGKRFRVDYGNKHLFLKI